MRKKQNKKLNRKKQLISFDTFGWKTINRLFLDTFAMEATKASIKWKHSIFSFFYIFSFFLYFLSLSFLFFVSFQSFLFFLSFLYSQFFLLSNQRLGKTRIFKGIERSKPKSCLDKNTKDISTDGKSEKLM